MTVLAIWFATKQDALSFWGDDISDTKTPTPTPIADADSGDRFAIVFVDVRGIDGYRVDDYSHCIEEIDLGRYPLPETPTFSQENSSWPM